MCNIKIFVKRKQNSYIGAAASGRPPFIGSYIGVLLSLYKKLDIIFDLY